MLLYVFGVSTLASIFKLFLLLILFFLLLVAAHLFTKWFAKSGYANPKSTNISVIESQQLSPGKNLMIAKIGNKYVSFIMFKENAVFLTELDEEDLLISTTNDTTEVSNASFKEILKKLKERKEEN